MSTSNADILARRDAGQAVLEGFAKSHPDATASQAVALLKEFDLSYRRQDMLADWRMATGREARGIQNVSVRDYEKLGAQHRIYHAPKGITPGAVQAGRYYNRSAKYMFATEVMKDKNGNIVYRSTKPVSVDRFDHLTKAIELLEGGYADEYEAIGYEIVFMR